MTRRPRRQRYALVEGPHGYQRVFAKGGKKINRPEQAGQIAIFNYLAPIMKQQECREFVAMAIPNGGYRTSFEAQILIEMGVFPGAADFQILLPKEKMEWAPDPADDIPVMRPWLDKVNALMATFERPRTIFVECKALPPPPKIRYRKDGVTPIKQRARNPRAGMEESQERFESIVTAFGFEYYVLAYVDPYDAVRQIRALMQKLRVKGF